VSPVRIKLCGVRTADDARLCAEAGADEIGVIFAERSKRRVSIETARAIRAALPAQVPLVGVFLDAPLAEVERVVAEVGLQAAQLHGAWPGGPGPVPLYAALQIHDESSLQPRPGAARILLDGPAGGSGLSFAWTLAHKARAVFDGPLFVSGGLTPDNVAQAIAQARPDGVDVASGIENAAGFKDAERVRAFVKAAREAVRK
jgi:phosphoribosylanthranilate isomerase